MMKSPKQVFITGMFYAFIGMTIVAFLFHLFGINWFASTVETVPEPTEVVEQAVLAILKAFELLFVHRMLTHRSWLLCLILAIVQVGIVGFIPSDLFQKVTDFGIMLVVAIVFRKDKLRALGNFVVLAILMNIYSALMLVAKFGGIVEDFTYSFYANIASLIDYKLFIVTVYLYTKYRKEVKANGRGKEQPGTDASEGTA